MTSITDRAMLVAVSISAWTARKHDRTISAEVARDYNAASNVGRYNKTLLAKTALADVQSTITAARAFYYENTLPWRDDGMRILPSANFMTFVEKIAELKASYENAVNRFVEAYPSYVEDARARLNGMFKDEDYPDPIKVIRKFGFEVSTYPMPTAADFRVQLGDEAEARIRTEIEAKVTSAVDGAMRDLWTRIHDTVGKMHERLMAYTVDDKGKVTGGVFRDTLVSNLAELVDLLPRLNLTGDANLEAMRQRLSASLCKYEPQTLRDSVAAREEVKRSAESILADMAGYIGS